MRNSIFFVLRTDRGVRIAAQRALQTETFIKRSPRGDDAAVHMRAFGEHASIAVSSATEPLSRAQVCAAAVDEVTRLNNYASTTSIAWRHTHSPMRLMGSGRVGRSCP